MNYECLLNTRFYKSTLHNSPFTITKSNAQPLYATHHATATY